MIDVIGHSLVILSPVILIAGFCWSASSRGRYEKELIVEVTWIVAIAMFVIGVVIYPK